MSDDRIHIASVLERLVGVPKPDEPLFLLHDQGAANGIYRVVDGSLGLPSYPRFPETRVAMRVDGHIVAVHVSGSSESLPKDARLVYACSRGCCDIAQLNAGPCQRCGSPTVLAGLTAAIVPTTPSDPGEPR